MKAYKVLFWSVLTVSAFMSCRIQDAPGAYARAKGQVEKSDVAQTVKAGMDNGKAEVSKAVPVHPTPDPDVRHGSVVGGKPGNAVEEPPLVSSAEIQNAMNETPLPVPVVVEDSKTSASEPEITRKESFTVVEGQQDADVRNYNVVVGSFGKLANAQNLQRILRQQMGENPILVQNEQKMYRVILASFEEYKDARAKINTILTQFPDAWVLVQK